MALDFAIARIDLDACEASWSYSGFNAFRERLAGQLGFVLDEMDGFGGDRDWDSALIIVAAGDLKPLLHHSDCEGSLHYDACQIIAPALREAVKDWPDDDYDKINALRLCEAMECMDDTDKLLFC